MQRSQIEYIHAVSWLLIILLLLHLCDASKLIRKLNMGCGASHHAQPAQPGQIHAQDPAKSDDIKEDDDIKALVSTLEKKKRRNSHARSPSTSSFHVDSARMPLLRRELVNNLLSVYNDGATHSRRKRLQEHSAPVGTWILREFSDQEVDFIIDHYVGDGDFLLRHQLDLLVRDAYTRLSDPCHRRFTDLMAQVDI